MKKYEQYVVCAVLWDNKFPSHWDVLPMYALAHEKSICNHTELPLLSVYLDVGVIPFDKKEEKRTNVTSKDLSKYQMVEPGDFVLNNQQAWRGSVGVSFDTGIVSPAYIVLSMNNKLYNRYANYLLRSRIMVDQYLINSKSVGSIQRNIYWSSLKRILVPVPPHDEQEQIVRFLDWKVSEINKLVNIKRQEIKALEELKQSIISHSVIKGLNSSTAKKYNETKWLGDIPIHWQLKKIGALFVERKIKVSDKDFAPLSVAKIGVVPQLETAVKTDAGDNRKLVCVGDFVINSRSDRKGSCGVSNLDGSVSLINIVLVPRDELNINYVHYLLRSQPFSEEYYRNGRGIVADLWTTRYSEMKSIMLPVPPFDEQEEIARFLDCKVSKINKLMNIKRNDIDSLNELKIKLIADVVTGKIDVCGIKVPDYEFVAENADSDIDDNEDAEAAEEN